MENWPIPRNIKALRGFLGLTGYYRRFVRHYGVISRPLNNLLKKGAFKWDEAATKSFLQLKHAMCTTLVLRMPDFTKPFVVETDACHTGIGVVLMQEGQPIAYFSKAFAPKNMGLSTYEKELLAVVAATQKWRGYLLGCTFIIKTDQQAICYLLGQKISTPAQQKWLTKLLGFDYTIEDKRGKENVVADPLSRLHKPRKMEDTPIGSLYAISSVVPHWKLEVRSSLENDVFFTNIFSQLAIKPSLVPDFALIEEDL